MTNSVELNCYHYSDLIWWDSNFHLLLGNLLDCTFYVYFQNFESLIDSRCCILSVDIYTAHGVKVLCCWLYSVYILCHQLCQSQYKLALSTGKGKEFFIILLARFSSCQLNHMELSSLWSLLPSNRSDDYYCLMAYLKCTFPAYVLCSLGWSKVRSIWSQQFNYEEDN